MYALTAGVTPTVATMIFATAQKHAAQASVLKETIPAALTSAMKMQTPVNSEVAGKVSKISVELGQAVDLGDKLVKIEMAEE